MTKYGSSTKNTWNVPSIERLIKVKELYDKYGTLQLVANELGLTRERVRQLLKNGQKRRLYRYELTREKKLKSLVAQVSKDNLIKVMSFTNKLDKICSQLEISEKQFYILIRHYNINTYDVATISRRKRAIQEYMRIVELLGHHPTTTELIRIPKWRALWVRIDRYWGSIESFRKDYGIDKPKQYIHPNTQIAWTKAIESNKKRKKEKLDKVYDYFLVHNIATIWDVVRALGYTRVSTSNYFKNLLEEGKITRVGKGTLTKYKKL